MWHGRGCGGGRGGSGYNHNKRKINDICRINLPSFVTYCISSYNTKFTTILGLRPTASLKTPPQIAPLMEVTALHLFRRISSLSVISY
jgi:hypothetical protein